MAEQQAVYQSLCGSYFICITVSSPTIKNTLSTKVGSIDGSELCDDCRTLSSGQFPGI